MTVAVLTVVVVGGWVRQQMAIDSRDQAVTANDLRILQKADALLTDASVWNRHDDRVCADDEAGGNSVCLIGSMAHDGVAPET